MSDYQAVYDAIRSRFPSFDTHALSNEIARQFDVSHAIELIKQEYSYAAILQQEPSVLYRPKLSIDGDQWCALYGDNLQAGVAGFGDSPEKAMDDFNKAWKKSIK